MSSNETGGGALGGAARGESPPLVFPVMGCWRVMRLAPVLQQLQLQGFRGTICA